MPLFEKQRERLGQGYNTAKQRAKKIGIISAVGLAGVAVAPHIGDSDTQPIPSMPEASTEPAPLAAKKRAKGHQPHQTVEIADRTRLYNEADPSSLPCAFLRDPAEAQTVGKQTKSMIQIRTHSLVPADTLAPLEVADACNSTVWVRIGSVAAYNETS